MKDFSIKMPNSYVRTDLNGLSNLNRKFYIVYLLIGKHRFAGDYSWLTLGKVHEFYNVKDKRTKSDISKGVVGVLDYMGKASMIEVISDLSKITSNEVIEVKINPEIFDPATDYTEVYLSDLDYVAQANTPVNRENLLIVMLYMLSYINPRHEAFSFEQRMGFYRSIESFHNDTGLATKTIYSCIDVLISDQPERPALFAKGKPKYEHGIKKLPSVYVLKEGDYEARLEKIIKWIEEINS